ncbi:unnamed protein product [Lactuca saligna]|uniref:Uncharacterized protein n=1 Tax=Lactuca saligna TaxID=75948 RepID=A0AA35ZTJ8_LACSI|nr:unnamed protein product [Lactuca saligna]
MENQDVDMIIDTFKLVVNSVKEQKDTNHFSRTINMVPSGFRDLSPSSFDPRVVSIGPLHRHDEALQLFEDQKATYVDSLLQRVPSPPEQTLKECLLKVVASIDMIRASYPRIEKAYSDIELSTMMVMDASFILEFILMISISSDEQKQLLRGSPMIYDLVLVENQIPFLVLNLIFDLTIAKSQLTNTLTELLLDLVQFFNIFETKLTVSDRTVDFHLDHILGFLETCYWPSLKYTPSEGLPGSAIHSTIELNRAGIIFTPYRDERWQMTMEYKSSKFPYFSWFWFKPSLRMPVVRIDNITELILRNLIAYERTSTYPSYMTSYAAAMDMLVETQEDIAKLIESKVLLNHLGSNEKATSMIKSICAPNRLENFYYVDQCQELDEYYNRYWPKNIAVLKGTYFSSPWNTIALLAGIILFSLTVVQTIYTVNAA